MSDQNIKYEAQIQRDGMWWRLAGHFDLRRLADIVKSEKDWKELPHRFVKITSTTAGKVVEAP